MTKRWTKIDFFKVGQSDMIPPQDKAEATVDHTAACRRVWGQRWTGPVRRLSAWACDMRHMERAFL